MKEKEEESSQKETWRLDIRADAETPDRFLQPNAMIEHRPKEIQNVISIDNFPSMNTKNLEKYFRKYKKLVIDDEKKTLETSTEDNNEEVMIEGFLIMVSGLATSTINDLSSELVKVNTALVHEKDLHESHVFQIDRLRAMLRVSSGNGSEYRSRIKEFKNFIQRFHEETWLLKTNIGEKTNLERCFNLNMNQINSLKSLMNELRMKLKNDQDALATSGNQWCSVYIEKIHELETCVENLLLQVEKTGSNLKFGTITLEPNDTEYHREMSEIEQLTKHVAYELKSLSMMPIKNGSRVGSESCSRYFRRIGSLEKLVSNSMSIIEKLYAYSKASQIEGSRPMKTKDSRCNEKIRTLEILGKKLILGIKQLEKVVAPGDGMHLFEKIRRLEASIKRLKNQLKKSEEDKASLTLKLTGAKIAYDEQFEELEIIRRKHEKISNKLKNRDKLLNDEEHMVKIIRELEQSKLNASVLGDEVNRLNSELRNIRSEKEQLVNEIENIQSTMITKKEEIARIIKEKKNKERILTKETIDMKTKLTSAEKTMQLLKKEISDLRNDESARENEAIAEIKKLKSLLKNTSENLELKNRKIVDLESNLIEIKIEKAKTEQELSCSKKQIETAIIRLNAEKTSHSKVRKDFEKHLSDYRSFTVDLENIREEKKNLQKNVDHLEREKAHLKAEIDNQHREKKLMENESSCLKSKINKLKQTLDEQLATHREHDEELQKYIEKNKEQEIRANFLIKENESLKDELDQARADKLNIVGTLNEVKYNYETTKNLLNSKVTETKKLEDKLEITLVDLETLRKSEHLAKSEVVKLLEASTKLNGTIDVVNSDKERLEKRLRDVENDCEVLENKLCIFNAEKEALMSDSSKLNQRVHELTEEVTVLRNKVEQNSEERSQLIGDHENTVGELKRKLLELETERANLANEVMRVSDENSPLKRDYEKIACENENVRSRGKKDEISRLADENEALKLQLSKWTIFISEADREVAKKEIEKMCSELAQIRAENSSLKKLRNRRRIVDEKSLKGSRKLEDEINVWKSENELLRNNLDIAKNQIILNEKKLRDIETEKNLLKGSIEGLKERYKVSIKDTEDARLRNESLHHEIEGLKKNCEIMSLEDSALKQEVRNLHEDLINLKNENSEIRRSLVEKQNELLALKDELAKLRAENIALCNELESRNADRRCLEQENENLRNEIEGIRCESISVIEEVKELRNEQKNLVAVKLTLENKLIDAQKQIDKYDLASEQLYDLENKLKNAPKNLVIAKKMLVLANEEIDHLRRSVNPSFRNSNYTEKIEAT